MHNMSVCNVVEVLSTLGEMSKSYRGSTARFVVGSSFSNYMFCLSKYKHSPMPLLHACIARLFPAIPLLIIDA